MNSKPHVSYAKKTGWLATAFVIATLVLSACAQSAAPAVTSAPTSAPAPTTAPLPTVAPAPTVAPTTAAALPSTGAEATINIVDNPTLGKILVDGKGLTLYAFTKDAPNQSNCNADCLKAWPVLHTQGKPTLGDGVDASLIGTTTATDGSMMVTYNKMPLYYWIGDSNPGDINGQGVQNVWFVVSPQGEMVGMTSAQPAATAAPADSGGGYGSASGGSASSQAAMIDVVSNPTLGDILVDSKGMTLYVFLKDTPDKSNCSGGCLQAWPPFLTQGAPTFGAKVDDSKVGTIKLDDGTTMVTYNHMPLYYYAKDTKAGDTTGQGVGGNWFVVSPDGEIVNSQGAKLDVATDAKLGDILVDGKGMTLYAFLKDGPDQSNCSGGCLQAWPPFLTQGTPEFGSKVDDSKIGTIKLADGTTMVTYNHMPLYYYAKDTKPGDTTGQDVGGNWYVVSPDGKVVDQ